MAFILILYCICEFLQNKLCSALRIALKGQILGVSSYHVHLLTGKAGQSDQQFYFMATTYISTSVLWWVLFRIFKSVYVLSFPFLFYGLAFFVLGLANNAKTVSVRDWVENIATAFYSTASSSYWVYFSLNFANERWSPKVPPRKLSQLTSSQVMCQL